MIDSFPYDRWSEQVSAFWTFGGGGSAGTYVLTVLGMILMVAALIGWVWLENQKLTAQRDRLRAAGALPVPAAPPRFGEPTPPAP